MLERLWNRRELAEILVCCSQSILEMTIRCTPSFTVVIIIDKIKVTDRRTMLLVV